MDKEAIKIAGNGKIVEGEYGEVKIMGNANASGNIKAETIQVMGSGKFDGNVETKTCTIFGDANIVGDIRAERLKVNGNLDLRGACQVEELIVNGSTRINGVIQCNNVTIKGDLKLDKDCKANSLRVYGGLSTPANISGEEIKVEGGLDCKGLMTAENIYLHAFNHSYCKEIGATKLVVERPFYHIFWFGYSKKNSLTCDVIEGDEIKLENVTVKELRGKNIELVKQCDVGHLEFSEDYRRGAECTIKEVTKFD